MTFRHTDDQSPAKTKPSAREMTLSHTDDQNLTQSKPSPRQWTLGQTDGQSPAKTEPSPTRGKTLSRTDDQLLSGKSKPSLWKLTN